MGVLGTHDLKDLVLPTLWDQTYLQNVRLQGNRTFNELMAEIQAGIGDFNQNDLLNQPHYSGLLAVQDTPEVEYATGSTGGVQQFVDYKVPDPIRGATTGHLLPRNVWMRTLGWTLMWMQRARQEQIDADLRSMFTDIRVHFQKLALIRFFKSTAVTIGNSGKSVPFADGGTADSTYVPYTSMRGSTFASSHSHFLRQAATLTTTLVNDAVATLWEHGHDAPYNAIIPLADIGTWSALANYRPIAWANLSYNNNTTVRANLSELSGDIFGYYESPYGLVALWATPFLSTGYYGIYKSYGGLDARNPLRMYINPAVGAGWNVAQGLYINAPQHLAVLMAEYDIGVGEDRTNGVAVLNAASGNYIDPTITL